MQEKRGQLGPHAPPHPVPGAFGDVKEPFFLLFQNQIPHSQEYGQQQKNIRPYVIHSANQALAGHPSDSFIREPGVVLRAFLHVPGGERRLFLSAGRPAEDADAAQDRAPLLHGLQIRPIARGLLPLLVQLLYQALFLPERIRERQVVAPLVPLIAGLEHAGGAFHGLDRQPVPHLVSHALQHQDILHQRHSVHGFFQSGDIGLLFRLRHG